MADTENAQGEAATVATSVTSLPKISVAGVGRRGDEALKAGPKDSNGNETPGRVSLMTVYGVATGVKTKADRDGNLHDGLVGQFEATNTKTGKVFRSGILYLPSGIQDQVQSAITSTDAAGDVTYSSAMFGFEVFGVPSRNAAGYSYEAEFLTDVTTEDSLVKMREAFAKRSTNMGQALLRALPSPGGQPDLQAEGTGAKTAEPEPEAAPKRPQGKS